ncbi:MAG: hypothetical protein IJ711_10565 [Lachnospiraceae bacterium]|nr:hypothetical protein [Lachnospiraceae bacterium]
MEFKYSHISEERCREIDSWNIKNPYQYPGGANSKLNPWNKKWVFNEDETILYCQAFRPYREDWTKDTHIKYLYIDKKEYFLFEYDTSDIHVECKEGKEYCIGKVKIFKNENIDNYADKKELLKTLKAMILIDCEHTYRGINSHDVFYNGEEIK